MKVEARIADAAFLSARFWALDASGAEADDRRRQELAQPLPDVGRPQHARGGRAAEERMTPAHPVSAGPCRDVAHLDLGKSNE